MTRDELIRARCARLQYELEHAEAGVLREDGTDGALLMVAMLDTLEPPDVLLEEPVEGTPV